MRTLETPRNGRRERAEVVGEGLRGRAVAVGRAVMETLGRREDLTELEVAHPVSGVPAPAWAPLSMDAGDTGLAVAHGVLADLWPDEGWDVRAHDFLRSALRTPLADAPLGVFGGVSGAALALRSLSRGGERYRSATADVEAGLYDRLAEDIDAAPSGGGLDVDRFDLISGLTGNAAHLLVAAGHGDERARNLLDRTMGLFADWASTDRPGGFWTPADRISPLERENAPELRGGYLNLGLSHGIAGPLAVMSLVRTAGGCDRDLRPAISVLADRILAAVTDTEHGHDVPYHELPVPTGDRPLSRTAWCYGNPGVARALQLAARACGRPELELWAEELLRAVARREPALRQADSPTVCHGQAGLVHVLHRFLADSAEPDPELAGFLHEELSALVDSHDPGHRFGFQDISPHTGPQDHPGLLEGAAGVAAVLVSFTHDAPMAWDRVFLTG